MIDSSGRRTNFSSKLQTSGGWQQGPSYVYPAANRVPGAGPVLQQEEPYEGPTGSGMQGRARNALRTAGMYGAQMGGIGNQAAALYGGVYAPGVRRAYQTAEMPIQDLVDRASIDTGLAFNKSQGILNRNMSRMGINPNSGRFQGLQQQWGLARAAAEAGAMTRARRQGREDNFRRLLDAVGAASDAGGTALNAYGGAAGTAMDMSGQYDRWAGEEGARSAYGNPPRSPLQQELDQDLGTTRQSYAKRQAGNAQRYADRQTRNYNTYWDRQNSL